ncbi:MAG: IclR family transcriptional regulator [Burkholderiales bacterium]
MDKTLRQITAASPAVRDATGSSNERKQVTALARGLQILQCFTTTRKQLGSAEIARITGLPQATAWRLCQTLLRAGFLSTSLGNQRLQLGASVLALGFAASAAYDILEVVRPRMQALADRFNASCSVAGRDGVDMVYLQRCVAQAMLGMNLQRGSRIPLVNTALGWAYLAALGESARSAALREIRRSDPANWPAVESQLDLARRDYERKGYVLRKGLAHRGIIAIAVPIISTTNSQVLAINCSAQASAISAKQLETAVAPLLKELASAIGGALSSTAALTPAEQ